MNVLHVRTEPGSVVHLALEKNARHLWLISTSFVVLDPVLPTAILFLHGWLHPSATLTLLVKLCFVMTLLISPISSNLG